MERILRQQKEARLAAAAEAERLKKEREKAQQLVSPLLPSDVEKASLLSGTLPSTQALVPPAAGGVSATFTRHLQNLKRRTGLGSNDQNQPLTQLENKPVTNASPTPPPLPRLDNKPTHLPSPVAPTVGNKPAIDSRGRSPSPPPVAKPLSLPPISSDYSLNEQYLSSAKAPQPQTPGLSWDEEYMPGSFPPIANGGHRDVNSRPTPLSDICRYLFFPCFLSNQFSVARNIDLAISACKSESGDVLQNRERMERVKESLNDGYCDISGRKDNLHHIGILKFGSMAIY